jgi:hypothetical protein
LVRSIYLINRNDPFADFEGNFGILEKNPKFYLTLKINNNTPAHNTYYTISMGFHLYQIINDDFQKKIPFDVIKIEEKFLKSVQNKIF